MADEYGIDTSQVFIPITGNIAVADHGIDLPTPEEGGSLDYVLPTDFRRPGLIARDGGFDWTFERDGDPILFLQEGFEIPTGLANATCVVKLSQTSHIVREIVHGKTPDVNGYITIDAGGHAKRFEIWTEEIAKNGWIRRTIAGIATVDSAKVDKTENGAANGTEVTFKIHRDPRLGNEHVGQWLIAPGATVIATLISAAPAAAAGGAEVTITGQHFLGATTVRFGAQNSPHFTVDSDTTIRAIVPAGGAGSAAIKVINEIGESAALAYNRGVAA